MSRYFSCRHDIAAVKRPAPSNAISDLSWNVAPYKSMLMVTQCDWIFWSQERSPAPLRMSES
jgi:hypothetical protein